MPLFIVNDDITKLKVDAIVNAANRSLLGGGGVDGAIHRAAGKDLLKECKTLNGCQTGEAKITKGYKLPAKYVIHAVGPVWHGGKRNEEELLTSCYSNSLKLAVENQCKSVAFPMISAGVYGYPKIKAFKVAVKTINSFFHNYNEDIDVYLVLFGRDANNFLDIDNAILEHLDNAFDRDDLEVEELSEDKPILKNINPLTGTLISRLNPKSLLMNKKKDTSFWDLFKINKLNEAINKSEESFSSMVMRLINEKHLDEVACYKAANVNKQIFYKIRRHASKPDGIPYQPAKAIALAFAIALKLDIEETKKLLEKAGYTLSKCYKTDIIIEYCISNSINDINKVNEILFYYKLPLIGSKYN